MISLCFHGNFMGTFSVEQTGVHEITGQLHENFTTRSMFDMNLSW